MKSIMRLKFLYSLLLVFAIYCVGSISQASQMRVLLGPKIETASNTASSISNTNPLSLIFEYDLKMKSRIYLSIGASGDFDVANLASSGFGLFGSVRYYLKGNPSLVKSKGKDIQVSFVEPYSYFIGLGFFQKTISFDSGAANVKDISEDVGGLIFSGGGNYSLTNRYYLAGYAQYLLGGSGAKIDYTSIEFYGGIGLRF